MSEHAALIRALTEAAGPDALSTDPRTLALYATDLYEAGPTPVAAVRPRSPKAVADTVAAVTSLDYAVVPRGGGLSYTGGYACEPGRTVIVDLGGLDRIEEIAEADMIVTAEAGVTWKQLHQALAPRRLRLPFFGTFSGAGATVGGGLSHGALFFGSARYGSAADNALAIEVATADGTLLRTGQWALQTKSLPVFRGFGPDLTGLFLHDGGALGIKTRASFRLIRQPAATGFASFAFPSLDRAAQALSGLAREGVAEDAYVLDPAAIAAASAERRGLGAAIEAMRAVARSAGSGLGALGALGELARAGRTIAPAGAFTLHCVAAASSRPGMVRDLAAARAIARGHGGKAIASTIPRIARADLFRDLDGVLDPDGRRWVALNAKVAHSQAGRLIGEHGALTARHAESMARHGITVTYLLSALGMHCFSFESVFHWSDAWLPIHSEKASAARLQALREPPANPAARALVAALREETVTLFARLGAASNQIGRTYPYLEALQPASAELLRDLKTMLDPGRSMNPGVLGL